MSTTGHIAQYSRQELYDLIWSTPTSQLAADLGISDAAIVKQCKKLNVPRPSRRYWTKIAAGHKPRKKPLNPTTDEEFTQIARGWLRKNLRLPGTTEPLLPPASELANAIAKGKLDDYNRVRVEDPTLPRAMVSKNLADHAARALHVLIRELEPLGIVFQEFKGTFEGAYFARRRDRMYLTIAEDIKRPDGSRITAPWYRSAQPNEKASGYLTFSFKPYRWRDDETQEWSESPKLPLGKLLAQVVAGLRDRFVRRQEDREQWEIEQVRARAERLERQRQWEKEEVIRLQQEKERNHAEALAAVVQDRRSALLKAAKKWRRSNRLLDFIAACEARWNAAPAIPTPEQVAWLNWARDIASSMSPFPVGYPDPANDGPFDPTSIPFGGPYPDAREFSRYSAPSPAPGAEPEGSAQPGVTVPP